MKTYFIISTIIICVFSPRPCSAQDTLQTSQILDTIYANDIKNVTLFFPGPIRHGITGSENFVFTYNREREQYFGLLQAKPGKESNLLVINSDGSVFSYIVSYSTSLSRLNYFIPKSSSIGNEKPRIKDSIQFASEETKINNKDFYYQKFCSYILEKKQQIGSIKKEVKDLVLSVENIVFDSDELYFVIQIKNNSTLDYDVNFLNLSTVTRQKGKKRSLQKLYHEPLFRHHMPSRISKNETVRLVYVVPKFSLSNQRRAVLELNEKDGERHIALQVSHRHTNNPN